MERGKRIENKNEKNENFGQSNSLVRALHLKNIHSKRATSPGHRKEIQELLFLSKVG